MTIVLGLPHGIQGLFVQLFPGDDSDNQHLFVMSKVQNYVRGEFHAEIKLMVDTNNNWMRIKMRVMYCIYLLMVNI